ncbi:MAG: D-alanine--D-alanine ligase [Nitrospirae bacterium]|nr:D-alanine--D-alanine ligase [Magnetococcales bacterium]HAT51033.1 D-alanine--D-alanine ligase [Alphaproteobacteria bacterium]
MDDKQSIPISRYGNIAILMGGVSREREVSLRSGNALVAAYQRLNIPVHPMDIQSFRSLVPTLIEKNIQTAVLALHGPCGEDGAIQGLLETMSIPYSGSGIAASAICMDKVLCKRLLRDAGLPTPDWSLAHVRDGQIDKRDPDTPWVEAPVFVKPASSGSSFGVFFVKTLESLKDVLIKSAQMSETYQETSALMVEKAVVGFELTLSILDDQPLPIIEIQPEKGFYSYDNKYTAGRTCYKIPPDNVDARVLDEVTQLGLEAGRVMGCRGLYRVDFMVDLNKRPWILEINTTPGLTATSLAPKAALAVGISFDALAARILAGSRLDRCCADS